MTPRDITPNVNNPVDFFKPIFNVNRTATSRCDIAPSVHAPSTIDNLDDFYATHLQHHHFKQAMPRAVHSLS